MTGKSKLRLVSKKILTYDNFRDNLVNYVVDSVEAALKADFPLSGFFGARPSAFVHPSSSVIGITSGGPFLATDGIGHLLAFDNTTFPTVQLPQGLADGTTCHVGLERAMLDQGVEVNPRTQLVNYRKQTEAIGRAGTPDAVVDNGDGTLTFTVDAVTEAGVDYSGRTITVWLKALEDGGLVGPLSPVEATAIETRTIAFAGGHNKITTTGKFGQGSAPSTLVSDYIIVMNGPTVKRSATEDLTQTAGVVMLLAVTAGGGDAAQIFDDSVQVQLIGAGELLEVLKRGPNGGLKVKVSAVNADAGVDQISVVGPLGDTVFSVEEDGTYDGKISARWSCLSEEWQYADLSTVADKWISGTNHFSGGATVPNISDPDPANYPAPFLSMAPQNSPNGDVYWTFARAIAAVSPHVALVMDWEWSITSLTGLNAPTEWNSVGVGLVGTPDVPNSVADCIWIKADFTSANVLVCEARSASVASSLSLLPVIPVATYPKQRCRLMVYGELTPIGAAAGGKVARFYVDGQLKATLDAHIPTGVLRPYMFMKVSNGTTRTMNVSPVKLTLNRY